MGCLVLPSILLSWEVHYGCILLLSDYKLTSAKVYVQFRGSFIH